MMRSLFSVPLRSLLPAALLPLALAACGETADEPNGARTIEVSITGEEAATEGIVFDPMPKEGAVVFLDGWTIKFDRWLVALKAVRLNEPGPDPAQQQKVGALVAQTEGPWLINLTRPEAGELTPLSTFARKGDGGSFDTTLRYAFSFDTAPATVASRRMNLSAEDQGAADTMVQQRLTHYVEGTATHAADSSPEFMGYPTTIKFRFGWGGQVSYLNCSNPDNGNDETQNRGVQPRKDRAQRATLTMHLEHPFWDKLNVEDPPLRFDPIAARARPGAMGAPAEVTLDDLDGSLVTTLKDRDGQGVPDRGQLPGYTPKMGPLSYDVNGASGVTTLKEFVIYAAQSMAHLNGEGLCYVERR